MAVRYDTARRRSRFRGWQLRIRGQHRRGWYPGRGGEVAGYTNHADVYVGVPDVEAALQKAESLGGKRQMGPDQAPGSDLVVGHFTDPEGNLIGVAGPV